MRLPLAHGLPAVICEVIDLNGAGAGAEGEAGAGGGEGGVVDCRPWDRRWGQSYGGSEGRHWNARGGEVEWVEGTGERRNERRLAWGGQGKMIFVESTIKSGITYIKNTKNFLSASGLELLDLPHDFCEVSLRFFSSTRVPRRFSRRS